MPHYDFKNKRANVRQLNDYMLAKTLSMFEYSGLPETIPAKELEKLLQKHGYAFITKAPDGELYAFNGGLGGEPDVYGNATQINIANPALKFNKTLDLKADGVFVESDDMRMGLLRYFEKNNSILVENEINMAIWGYNSRNQKMISAPDDKTRASAELYLKKLIDGELSVIGENEFFDGVRLQSAAAGASQPVTQFIEFHQYVKGSMYNEVGLSAAFNMKRERLISSELDQSEDSIFALVYNMMANRLIAVAAINEMYGTNISVDFGSVWKHKERELVDGNPDTPAVDNPADNTADTDTDVDTAADTDTDVDTAADTDTDVDTAADTDTDVDTAADTDSAPESDLTNTDTDTGTDIEATATDPEPESEEVNSDDAGTDDNSELSDEQKPDAEETEDSEPMPVDGEDSDEEKGDKK